MAAPHVTGVAALIASSSPGLAADPVAMKARILALGQGHLQDGGQDGDGAHRRRVPGARLRRAGGSGTDRGRVRQERDPGQDFRQGPCELAGGDRRDDRDRRVSRHRRAGTGPMVKQVNATTSPDHGPDHHPRQDLYVPRPGPRPRRQLGRRTPRARPSGRRGTRSRARSRRTRARGAPRRARRGRAGTPATRARPGRRSRSRSAAGRSPSSPPRARHAAAFEALRR